MDKRLRRVYKAICKMSFYPRVHHIHDVINNRQRLQKAIGNSNKAFIKISGYDCDWTYGESVMFISGGLVSIDQNLLKIYSESEGPIHISFISEKEFNEYHPAPQHNLVERAFENGHQHCVHVH